MKEVKIQKNLPLIFTHDPIKKDYCVEIEKEVSFYVYIWFIIE